MNKYSLGTVPNIPPPFILVKVIKFSPFPLKLILALFLGPSGILKLTLALRLLFDTPSYVAYSLNPSEVKFAFLNLSRASLR